jgi:ABC-type transport system substrate-binding protein
MDVNIQVVDTPVNKTSSSLSAQHHRPINRLARSGPGSTLAPSTTCHSANVFTSTGVHTTSNDTKADAMYQAAITEVDDTKAKKMWQDMMHYGYDSMWVNVELVEVPTYFAVGMKVCPFTAARGSISRILT